MENSSVVREQINDIREEIRRMRKIVEEIKSDEVYDNMPELRRREIGRAQKLMRQNVDLIRYLRTYGREIEQA